MCTSTKAAKVADQPPEERENHERLQREVEADRTVLSDRVQVAAAARLARLLEPPQIVMVDRPKR
eukprot:6669967-Prymnesium_polylepis.1